MERACTLCKRLPDDVQQTEVAVIGAGALGSMVAEMLARAGVSVMLIIDSENVEMGYLVRHTLTSADLGRRKVEAIAHSLTTHSRQCVHRHNPLE